MTEYKYRELEYAEKIYQEGFQSSGHMPTELRLTAIYMRRVLGYKPKQLKEKLYHWCESHIEQFNPAIHYQIMNTAIRAAVRKDSTLIQVDSVSISQTELDYLIGCRLLPAGPELDYNCRKLMFTFLCYSKIIRAIARLRNSDDSRASQNIFFRGGQKKYAALKKMAGLPDKVKIHEDVIHHLYCSNLITPLHSGLIRLDFMNEMNQAGSGTSPALIIRQLEICGWYFDLYNRKNNIFLCSGCGKLFRSRTKNTNQKYCRPCLMENPYYRPLADKTFCCRGCGREITVPARDNRTDRCKSCYSVYRKQYKADKERERRLKMKLGVDSPASGQNS